MSTDLLAMHRAFLEEVIAKREKLRKEDDQLAAVEDYHRRIVEELAPAGQNGTAATGGRSREVKDMRLLRAQRHEACQIALEELGGHAKTQEIAAWLRARGYGSEFDERVFQNTCYTALTRKTELFEKVGPGEWKLAS